MTIKRAILASLERVGNYLMPEEALWADVNALLAQPISLTEMRSVCSACEAQRLIVTVGDQETGKPKHRITDNGRAWLAA